MKQNEGWMNALMALVLIAFPALVGFYFLLPDWTGKYVLTYGLMWVVGLSFFIYSIATFALLIFFKVIAIESLSFAIPMTLVFIALFVSYGIPLWGRVLIIISLVFFAFPVNMMVTKLKEHIIYKKKTKNI